MENLMEGCPIVIEVPVAWGEMDSYQHVNNTYYFRWFESVRFAYLNRVGILDMMARTGIGAILASTACKFKIPLTYPNRVLAGAYVTTIGEDRFAMGYRLVSFNHQKVAAEGEAVIVAYDYREKKKAPLPDEWRRGIWDLEGKGEF